MVFGPLNLDFAPGALRDLGVITTPGAYANPDGSTMTLDQMRGDTGDGGGGGGETGDTDRDNTKPPGPTQDEIDEANRRKNAIGAMRGLMQQYGLLSLMTKITQYVQDGYKDPDAIMALIRNTPEYKQRFPAMDALIREGRPISEGEYIEFERSAAALERSYGLPAGMVDDRDTITNLLSNDVSARELEQRVTMAAAGAFQTTPEVKQQFQDFYGINAGGLTAYFLDPDKALPLLNKQYASAQIGAEGGYQGFDIQADTAERLTEMGVSRDQARQGFRRASRFRPLSEGRGDTATADQLIGSELMGEQDSTRAIERAQSARRGRFQEGGGFTSTQQGARGIGSAQTS